MKIAPPFLPDPGAFRTPPLILSSQEQLQGFREARLPRPVAAHNQRQSRTGSKRDGRLWPYSAKAFDSDRFDICAERWFGLFRLDFGPRRSAAPKNRLNLVEKRSQDQIGYPILQARAIQSIQNIGLKKVVH